ncbi:MAG: outer membrane protein assembly factor BamD [Planctomycetes bacterium]|nr:outer membrane protein assembly factor BamD [Planctomycetota bacterium]
MKVNELGIINDMGEVVLPGTEDYSMGRTNQTLEVAAGEEITITYRDELRLDPERPLLEAQLNSTYINGLLSLNFANEVKSSDKSSRIVYVPAKRIRLGDELMVEVKDGDEDLSHKQDTVEVRVKTSQGEYLKLNAVETFVKDIPTGKDVKAPPCHSGIFRAKLRFGGNTEGDTIKVSTGDTVTVSYLDKENTDPGVPVDRVDEVVEASFGDPDLRIYQARVESVEDLSSKAVDQAERLKSQRQDDQEVRINKKVIKAWYGVGEGIQKDSPVPIEGELRVNVQAPLLMELLYPRMALHGASEVEVFVSADTELAAAQAQNRDPVVLKIPMRITGLAGLANSKGYPVSIAGGSYGSQESMLDEGLFTGVARLQLGNPGDPVNDAVEIKEERFVTNEQVQTLDPTGERLKIPTLVVSGSDNINIVIMDEKGEELLRKKAALMSDASLELLDSKYQAVSKSVYLGQRFYLRLTDLDQDLGAEQDRVSLQVSSSSGDGLEIFLNETLPHSGIFTGWVEPVFIGRDSSGKLGVADKADEILNVNFGDTVCFKYEDHKPLSGEGIVLTSECGSIRLGSDGDMSCFSKNFKDPDMADKTSFLMAESLFQVSDHYKELRNEDEAQNALQRGKHLLEEALNDFPSSSLANQGEYLLARLAENLGNYQEAVGRYASVVSQHPEDALAPSAQYRKAYCLEKMKSFEPACEEYVKLTYLYPNSQEVAEASLRLGNYYHTNKKHSISGLIFSRFAEAHPNHEMAAKATFLSGEAAMMEKEYKTAILRFGKIMDRYSNDTQIMPLATYWIAEAYSKEKDYVRAYQNFKKLTWDYPESQWAKIARGRLTEAQFVKLKEDD